MKCLPILTLFISATLAWENFYNLKWSPGDKIGCQLNGVLGDLNFKHWMLGSDNSNKVIHIIGDKTEGYIDEQDKNSVPRDMFRSDYCVNMGQGRLGVQAVERARGFTGRRHRYSLTGCNCGHYVDFWADGGELCDRDEIAETAMLAAGLLLGRK